MPLSRERLEAKLAEAQAGRIAHMQQVAGHDGLIQAYTELLKEYDAPEIEPEPPPDAG